MKIEVPQPCRTVPSLSNNSGAQRDPIAFLERLKEALQKFTNLDLDSYEGQEILNDKFLSQCASDIRIKLQQLQQQGPIAPLDEMVQTSTDIFYSREQKREAKAQEREKRKEKRHAQDAGRPPGKPYGKPRVFEAQGMRQMPNL